MASCYLVSAPGYDTARDDDVVFLTYNDARSYAVGHINALLEAAGEPTITVEDDIDGYEVLIMELPLNPKYE